MEKKTQTYYHYTLKNNVLGIIKDGLKPGEDGLIYLCENLDDCLKFMRIYLKLFAGNSSSVEIAIIPVELDPADVEESYDHNAELVGCKAYTYDKAIPANKIPPLYKIPLYEY